jgi:CheY-like chemotaxis protein
MKPQSTRQRTGSAVSRLNDGEAMHGGAAIAAALAPGRRWEPREPDQGPREPAFSDGDFALGATTLPEGDFGRPTKWGKKSEHRLGPALSRVPRDSPPRILLAEDHDDTRALLACMLRQQGYEVTEATSGYDLLGEIAEAWLNRSGRLPDLIITDIRMPGPSGLRVLEGLRASVWSMPVVVITAFGDAATHVEALRLGAHVVLDKPFDLDVLRTSVAELLNQ